MQAPQSDDENRLVQWMKRQAVEGRFEHRTREIEKGVGLSMGRAKFALGVLRERRIVGIREDRSGRVVSNPFYFLEELRQMAQARWEQASSAPDR